MSVIGEAFVYVRPESTGFFESLKSKLTSESGKFGALGSVLGVAVVAGAGTALLEIGKKFEEARFTIEKETGATGKALESIFGTVKSVYSQVPGSLDAATKATDLLHVRTGLLGPALADAAKQQLYLAKITGTDVASNVDSATKLFAKYGIGVRDQSRELDVLFKASQQAGVSISQIIAPLQSGGAALQQFGFNLNTSTALIANLTKAGVNVTPALTALRTSFAKIVKDGGDPRAVLQGLISDLAGGKKPALAMAEAMKLFGARGGVELSAAIKAGKFDIDAMLKSITDGKGGIDSTGIATLSLGDKFALLKNKVLVALEPISTKLLDLVTKGFDTVSNWIDTHGDQIRATFEKWKTPIFAIGAAFALWLAPITTIAVGLGVLYDKNAKFRAIVDQVGSVLQSKISPALQSVSHWVTGSLVPALQSASTWLQSHFGPAMQAIGQWINTTAIPALQKFASFMSGTVWPIVQSVIAQIVTGFQTLVAGVRSRWVDIQQAISNVLTVIKVIIGAAVAIVLFVWTNAHNQIMAVVKAVWGAIGAQVQASLGVIEGIVDVFLGLLSGHWGRAWNGLKEIVKSVLSGIANIITTGLNIVKDVISAAAHIGAAIVQGLLNGIGDIGAAIWNHIKGGLGNVVDKVKHFFGIASPSKVFAEIGKNLMDGFTLGIDRNAPTAVARVAAMAQQVGVVKFPTVVAGMQAYAGAGSARIGTGSSTAGVAPSAMQIVLAPVFPPGLNHEQAMNEMKQFTLTELTHALSDISTAVNTGAGKG